MYVDSFFHLSVEQLLYICSWDLFFHLHDFIESQKLCKQENRLVPENA